LAHPVCHCTFKILAIIVTSLDCVVVSGAVIDNSNPAFSLSFTDSLSLCSRHTRNLTSAYEVNQKLLSSDVFPEL